jgi:hypothetical protein
MGIRRMLDAAAALIMLLSGIFLVVVVFPNQIPEGLQGDLSSGHYPRAVMLVWIISAAAWLIRSLSVADAEDELSIDRSDVRRSVCIASLIGLGFGLFVAVGFLAAAFVLIVSLAFVCGERGPMPWILAVVAPVTVYVFLDLFLDVRLPGALLPF